MKQLKITAFLLLGLLSGCALEPGAIVFRPEPGESASPAPIQTLSRKHSQPQS